MCIAVLSLIAGKGNKGKRKRKRKYYIIIVKAVE